MKVVCSIPDPYVVHAKVSLSKTLNPKIIFGECKCARIIIFLNRNISYCNRLLERRYINTVNVASFYQIQHRRMIPALFAVHL